MLNEKNSVVSVVLSICIRTIVNLMIIFFMYEVLVQSYSFSYMLFADIPYMSGQNSPITITVEEGENAKDIARELYDNRIIENQYIFLARAYLGKYSGKMRAGSYAVSSTMSPDTICRMLCGMQTEQSEESS